MKIRFADKKDFPVVIRLLEDISALHREGRPDMFTAGGAKYGEAELEAICQNPKTPILIADEGGEAVGYCFCKIRDDAAHGALAAHKCLWIDDLCVDESHRKNGIATALIEAAKAMGKQLGCSAVELNVWEFNENARAFYEKNGFSTQRRIMETLL